VGERGVYDSVASGAEEEQERVDFLVLEEGLDRCCSASGDGDRELGSSTLTSYSILVVTIILFLELKGFTSTTSGDAVAGNCRDFLAKERSTDRCLNILAPI
jgi:hypothetical protein